uniref:Putative secreted protein synganglion overexpressed n=1 Tax=Rhipicephalus microplus TaxID=6941 RepID=A0A6M2DCV8_RHIMP
MWLSCSFMFFVNMIHTGSTLLCGPALLENGQSLEEFMQALIISVATRKKKCRVPQHTREIDMRNSVSGLHSQLTSSIGKWLTSHSKHC